MKYLVLSASNKIVLRNLDSYSDANIALNDYLQRKNISLDEFDNYNIVSVKEYMRIVKELDDYYRANDLYY